MRKNPLAIAALVVAAAFSGCGSTAKPTSAPVQPVVAEVAPPPKPQTITLDHKLWSITVPASEGWTVDEDSEVGSQVTRAPSAAEHIAPILLEVSAMVDVDDAQEWVTTESMTVEQLTVELGGTVAGVKRGLIDWHGSVASITQVSTKESFFLGQLAVVDAKHHEGYTVVCVVPANSTDAKLMATVVKTFTLKDAAVEAKP